MNMAKKRPAIRSITIELADGRRKVIEGDELADPIGGVLVWNDYGAKTVLKGFYKECEKDERKAAKTQALWDGTADQLRDDGELPAVLMKPICAPTEWP